MLVCILIFSFQSKWFHPLLLLSCVYILSGRIIFNKSHPSHRTWYQVNIQTNAYVHEHIINIHVRIVSYTNTNIHTSQCELVCLCVFVILVKIRVAFKSILKLISHICQTWGCGSDVITTRPGTMLMFESLVNFQRNPSSIRAFI